MQVVHRSSSLGIHIDFILGAKNASVIIMAQFAIQKLVNVNVNITREETIVNSVKLVIMVIQQLVLLMTVNLARVFMELNV